MKSQDLEEYALSAVAISFIGAGNMARSLISGLLASGVGAGQLRASDPDAAQRAQLTASGITTFESNDAAVTDADVIVLAVKPQVLGAVLVSLDELSPEQLLVSIAAGVDLASLASWSSPAQPIVRCMPNTPALLGAGITALYANEQVTGQQRTLAEKILDAVGKTLWVASEETLDAVTALSGSGPAYYFYLMEAMVDAGIALGLDREMATQLTLETAYGASLMARNGAISPAQLLQNVASPGGTTAAALAILDAADARSTIKKALIGAAKRSSELAKEFGES